ncbi:MAG: uridine kinase [Acidimicrobiaceae bacterium]|nr:uridine kinase [Acidimicrobiaceae bacterium]MXW60705.1 uridine kinase [Acidimicrobiaceae bacterium]MXW75255.1 uridine kinase [Acidimicrobiaceae bacterium]MYA74032.1 uridine kinase [Acidimicrobiaceae bacterium]MYC42325.1 uridine kinase [Acidimicrobiaceae bacterium]
MGIIVGICGGSGAGKTTLVGELIRCLGPDRVSSVAFDAYYRDLSHITMQERMQVNYDHPDSLDHELFVEHLHDLRNGRTVEIPKYDFATHTRTGEVIVVEPKEIVILDGILLLNFGEISKLLDLAVFIDIPEAVRLERRTQRDVRERGRDADDVHRQFWETVAPMHDSFVQPSAEHADRVVTLEEKLEDVASELAVEITALQRHPG